MPLFETITHIFNLVCETSLQNEEIVGWIEKPQRSIVREALVATVLINMERIILQLYVYILGSCNLTPQLSGRLTQNSVCCR